eukprot:TRINITY_DN2421_c0_g1_i2.p1 TRINITY_DN2421_c0_g1~~TRINITY_DN2421_c0_g1_i2.p1  ORF type:complete len:334 (-),score=42.42 TRINITY_DN2421_c0_g1_i2:204-1103(-)
MEPIINSQISDWLYNYNTAYVPVFDSNGYLVESALAVRVQNLTANETTIYDVGPSSIVITQAKNGNDFCFDNIVTNNVILQPGPGQELGTEDPRVAYDHANKTYYLFYTGVTQGTVSSDLGPVKAMLSLAVNKGDPLDVTAWVEEGYLFPHLNWSKSGALLIREELPHYLFWGDSSICIANTTNLINYTNTGECLLTPRQNYFDSTLVESGPPPLPLSDGNYIFLYNSARQVNITNPKPGWNLQYNLGYAILDGKDPTKVLARSDNPILSPVLDWETCDTDSSPLGLTPNVVFVEGSWI